MNKANVYKKQGGLIFCKINKKVRKREKYYFSNVGHMTMYMEKNPLKNSKNTVSKAMRGFIR